jgi:hypothetical protein
MIRNTPNPMAATSRYTLAEIEAEVAYSEESLFLSVSRTREWRQHLETRSRNYLGRPPNTESANPEFGDWRLIA